MYKMHIRTTKLISMVIILLVSISLCRADDSTQSKQILRLGVNNWLFWRIHNDGKFAGADVDIWTEIVKRNNLKIEYTFIPNLKRVKSAMESDLIDAFVSMRKNSEREEYMVFIEPPFRTKLKIQTYVKTNSKMTINNFTDMYGKKMALVGGGYDKINNDSNIDAEKTLWNTKESFEKLKTGDVDVLHINEWQAIWYFSNEKNRDEFKLLNYTYSEYHPCYMVMSKKSCFTEEWLDIFGKTIQEIIDDGTMKEIVNSYVPGWYE